MNTRACRLAVPLLCVLLSACQQRMASQPSYRPDQVNPFFADDRRADRPLVAGTVARGHLRTDLALFTGRRTRVPGTARSAAALVGGLAGRNILGALAVAPTEYSDAVEEFPFPVTKEVLKHGQDRYMIYCIPCHDALGTGHGKIVERSYTRPPSYHIDRLRKAPVGHFFQVMTEGYGSMPDYKQQIPPRDRWAIAAYIRALQWSQHFPEGQLPAEDRARWQKQREGEGR